MIFQFPVMQLPYLILADRPPCMRRISHSGEIQIMQIMIMHACTEFSEWLSENSCMHDPAVGCLRSISFENAATACQRAICGNFRRQKWIPWRFLGLEKWRQFFFAQILTHPSWTLPHHTVGSYYSPLHTTRVHAAAYSCRIPTCSTYYQ